MSDQPIDIRASGAAEMARAIKAGTVSSLELVDAHIECVERDDGAINAVVWMDRDIARARAKAIDLARRNGDRSVAPLAGVPFTVKESFDVAGCASTWGVPERAGHLAETDAQVVRRLRACGAILIGKTNVPTMLADIQTSNPLFGRTNNPWNVDMTPGGSSGGGAAAVAAGFSPLDIGSDIGGSIRIPAAFCGVYSHKPSWGVCSYDGHGFNHTGPLDLAVVGPIARRVEDLAVAMAAAATTPIVAEQRDPRALRVAVLPPDQRFDIEGDIQVAMTDVARFLASCNIVVREAGPDIDAEQAAQLFGYLMQSALALRMDDAQFSAMQLGDDQNLSSFERRLRQIRTGSHRDWLLANEKRILMQGKWAAFFETHDLAIAPVFGTTAFPHDHSAPPWDRRININGSAHLIVDQMAWVALPGLAHLPSTVIPVELSASGMPIGLQIIGPLYADDRCLRFAAFLENEFYRFRAPPTGAPNVASQAPDAITSALIR